MSTVLVPFSELFTEHEAALRRDLRLGITADEVSKVKKSVRSLR